VTWATLYHLDLSQHAASQPIMTLIKIGAVAILLLSHIVYTERQLLLDSLQSRLQSRRAGRAKST
jgi:hypothetical protein